MGRIKSEVLKDQVFRRIVERSTDAIVMHDSRGRILYANNAAAEALLEKSPEALTGQSIIKFFPGPKREKYAALMERTLESGKPFVDVEFPLASGEGEALIASISGYPVESESGKAVVLDIRDVTARKLIEAGLERQLNTVRGELELLTSRNRGDNRLDAHLVHRIVVIHGSFMMKTAMRELLEDKRVDSRFYTYQDEYDISLVEKLGPDVAVFAFSSCSEVEIGDVKELLQAQRQQRVLVVCLNMQDEAALELLKSGVHGLITKEEEIKLVPTAINAIAEGELWCSRKLMRKMIDAYRVFQPGEGEDAAAESLLTEREKEILRLIAQSYRNREIAEKLGISYYTVVTHIYNIYRKLEVNRRVDAIRYAIAHKLIDVS